MDDTHLLRARWDGVLMEEMDREETAQERAGPVDSAEGAGDASALNNRPPAPNLVGIGYTFRPAAPLRIEVDGLFPLSSPGLPHGSLLVNLQVRL